MNAFVLAISMISLIFCIEGRADLNPNQKEFIEHFLNLSKTDLMREFEEAILENPKKAFKRGEELKALHWGKTYKNNPYVIAIRSDAPPSVKIHEAVHQFYNTQRPLEKDWITEGVAQAAEYFYDLETIGKESTLRSFLPIVNEYFKSPHRSLTTFEDTYPDYGKAFLFYMFLMGTFQERDFSRAHYQATNHSFSGIIEALDGSFWSTLTPKGWRNERVLITQFYWSLIQGRNTLSTTLNDHFSQILKNYGKTITAKPLTTARLQPHSFQYYSLRGTVCADRKFNLKAFDQIDVYAIKDQKTPRLVDSEELLLSENENEIFVVNLSSEPRDFQIECAR